MGSGIGKLFKGWYVNLYFSGSNDKKSPPPGYGWMIIGGLIGHVTATETSVQIRAKEGAILQKLTVIAAGTGTLGYPLFNLVTTGLTVQSAWSMNMVMPNQDLTVLGDATVEAFIQVIEFELS